MIAPTQDASPHSPASVADTSLNVDAAAALRLIHGPPIKRKSIKRKSEGSSSPTKSSASSFARGPNTTRNDIDAHRRGRGDSLAGSWRDDAGSELCISEATQRILERMDESQVKTARAGFRRVTLQRKISGIKPKDLGRLARQGSFRGFSGCRRRSGGGDSLGGSGKSGQGSLGSSGRSGQGSLDRSGRDTLVNSGRSNFSRSTGALGKQLESFDDNTDESSDEDEGQKNNAVGRNDKDNKGNAVVVSESEATAAFQPLTSEELRQLKEVEDSVDETLARIIEQNSAKNIAKDDEDPSEEGSANDIAFWKSVGARRSSRKRQALMPQQAASLSNVWKPLSREDRQGDGADKGANGDKDAGKDADGDKERAGTIGGLWTSFTKGITSSLTGETGSVSPPPGPDEPRQLGAAACFRKGKRKADRCQFLPAVVLFNLALVRQREELGEDHVDCGTTLNEIGVCWMMLGERYPALTAFEEALYIRQQGFGDGAQEVAEITNNIWIILHEARASLLQDEERDDLEEYEDEDDEE